MQTFEHLLPGEVIVHLVVKRQHDEGQAELRMGEHPHRMRQAAERHLQWNGDLLLHFLGRAAGIKRDDVDLDVGDIRKGFNRQRFEAAMPPPMNSTTSRIIKSGWYRAKETSLLITMLPAEVYDLSEESNSACSSKQPSVTTLWPVVTPSVTKILPSLSVPSLTTLRSYCPGAASTNM